MHAVYMCGVMCMLYVYTYVSVLVHVGSQKRMVGVLLITLYLNP